jgi:hypothetical protein
VFLQVLGLKRAATAGRIGVNASMAPGARTMPTFTNTMLGANATTNAPTPVAPYRIRVRRLPGTPDLLTITVIVNATLIALPIQTALVTFDVATSRSSATRLVMKPIKLVKATQAVPWAVPITRPA